MENLSKEDKIYYDKYLKYKEKYLNLKKVGGAIILGATPTTPATPADIMETKAPEPQNLNKEEDDSPSEVEIEEEESSSTEEEEVVEEEEEIQPVEEEKASEPEPSLYDNALANVNKYVDDLKKTYNDTTTGTQAFAIGLAAVTETSINVGLYGLTIPLGLGVSGVKYFSNAIGLAYKDTFKNDFIQTYLAGKFYFGLVESSINYKRDELNKDTEFEVNPVDLSKQFSKYLTTPIDSEFKKTFISKIIGTDTLQFLDKNVESLNEEEKKRLFCKDVTQITSRDDFLKYNNINLEILDKLSNDLIKKANMSTEKCDAKNNQSIDNIEKQIAEEQKLMDQKGISELSDEKKQKITNDEIDKIRNDIVSGNIDTKEIIVTPMAKAKSFLTSMFSKGAKLTRYATGNLTEEEKKADEEAKKKANQVKEDCSTKKQIMYEGFCIAVAMCWFLYHKYEKSLNKAIQENNIEMFTCDNNEETEETEETKTPQRQKSIDLLKESTEKNSKASEQLNLIKKKKEELQNALYHKSRIGSKMGFLYKYLEKTGDLESIKQDQIKQAEAQAEEKQEKQPEVLIPSFEEITDYDAVVQLIYDADNLIKKDFNNEETAKIEGKKFRQNMANSIKDSFDYKNYHFSASKSEEAPLEDTVGEAPPTYKEE